MLLRSLILTAATAVSATSSGQITSLDLSNSRLERTFALPMGAAAEASAVTYNWDRGTLFVLADEADALVEITRTGAVVSAMTLSGFDDTEGLTYIGNGRFVLTEERLQEAYLLDYAAGGSAARLPSVSLGQTVGNIGIEGISYDPMDGSFVAVKEKSPQAAYLAGLNFGAGTAAVANLFAPALGVSDLSDV